MASKTCCAISGFARAGSVFDTVKAVKDAGFDGVDFSLSTYSRKQGEGLASADWWREWITAVRTYLEELSLPVLQAHAPWEQTIPKDLAYVPPYPVFYRAIEACRMLGCTKLVFHPLLYPWRIESAGQMDALQDYNLRWFREVLPFAAAQGVTVLLENMFDYYHVQQPGDPAYIYTAAEQMIALCDALGTVGLCLDTGHANIAGQDVPGMIRAYGPRLQGLHLNDNYGRTRGIYEDLHLPPGEGTLDWPAIYAALRQNGYAGVYDLELIADLAKLPTQARVARLAGARNALAAAI